MKRLFVFLCVIGMIAVSLAVTAPSISASDTPLTTSRSDKSGQVMVKNDDGTIYLTTEIVDGEYVATSAANYKTPELAEGLPVRPVSIPLGFSQDVSVFLNSILSLVMVLAALLVFFYLIWGGFEWITSGGDKGQTEKARQKIMAAVIGLIIVSASYAILVVVINFLGFGSLNAVFENVKPLSNVRGGSRSQSELGRLNEATPSASPATVY